MPRLAEGEKEPDSMKVAILLLNQGRGSGAVARQHARHLIDRGCGVHFIHPGIGEGVAGAVNHDVTLHTTTIPVHEYLPAARANQKSVAMMSEEEASAYLPAYEQALDAVADDVDIIIGHHANLSAVATHRVATRRGKPYVLFIHGTAIEPRHHEGYDDGVWRMIEQAIRGAGGILVTTEYVRDGLVRPLIDLPDRRFFILPRGVDLDEFHPRRTDEIRARYDLPETYVICPGALTPSRGPQNVVEATRWYGDLAPTIFIGDGELRAALEHDLESRGRCLGLVPAEDRSLLVNAASILTAAPEKPERFGLAYVEALAAGTPPVAYGGGGVPSIVTPRVGVLTERSPEALGRAVRSLLDDPRKRVRMAEAGRRRAEKRYAHPDLVDRLQRWLEAVARRHEEQKNP
jgi:glycosyltransferase involved in cell wall biosynthesis